MNTKKLVLCQDCGRVEDYSDEKHMEEILCGCGGAFCGCPGCQVQSEQAFAEHYNEKTISREEIAVAALQGLLAGCQGPDDSWRVERAVIRAYRYADAMLAASKLDMNDDAAVRMFQIEWSDGVGL